MATGAQQTNAGTGSGGRVRGEPDVRRYARTAGPVADLTRPGMLPGSTTGAQGDPGRDQVAALGVDLQAIAPHTGF